MKWKHALASAFASAKARVTAARAAGLLGADGAAGQVALLQAPCTNYSAAHLHFVFSASFRARV